MAIILLLLLSAQWHQMPGPYLGCISDVEIIDPVGETLFVATMYSIGGGVFSSINGGQTWRMSASGIDDEIGYGMSQIAACPVDHNLMFCGTGFFGTNYVYRSTNQGQDWVLIATVSGSVSDIKFLPQSRTTVFLVTYGGIYKSTDSGISWNLKQTVNIGRAVCFKPNNPDTIFAGTFGGLLMSTDQGENWSSTPFTNPVYDLFIDYQKPDTIYVAGWVNGVYRVWHNGGASELLGLSGRYNTCITFDQIKNKIYVGGFYWYGRVCVSDDYGQSWYEYRQDQIPDDVINDIEVPTNNSDKVFAAGGSAGVCVLTSADSIWHLSSNGINQAVIRSIAVAPTDPNVIYVSMSNTGVWRSTDAGTTWSTNPQGPSWHKLHETEYWPPGLAVSPNDPNIVFATYHGGSTYYQKVLKSIDGGQNWTENTNGLDILPSECEIKWIVSHPWSSDTLFIATTCGAFKSVDQGNTWQQLNDYYLYHITVDPVEPNRIYATTSGAIYYSDDGGTTWKDRSIGLSLQSDVMMVYVDPQNNNIVYAALCGLEQSDPLSGIYISEDYGLTWTEKNSGLPEVIRRGRVMVDPVNSLIWATAPLLGPGVPGVYNSPDQGSSWFPADLGLNTNRTTYLAMGNYPLLGTQGNGIWYWADLPVEENAQPQQLKTFSIYPNPTKGQTTINYNLTEASKVKIRVIDITGRVVQNLMDKVVPAGNHSIAFQANLPSGVYFVKIETDEFSTGKKLLVIR